MSLGADESYDCDHWQGFALATLRVAHGPGGFFDPAARRELAAARRAFRACPCEVCSRERGRMDAPRRSAA